jgi:hypothetical protein
MSNTKPRLSKSVVQLREQADDAYPDRKRDSDGTIGDSKHSARKSDHNADPDSGYVRALDLDADFDKQASTAAYVADQIRTLAKSDKRIAYVIFNRKIASPRSFWKWRKYTGVNPHTSHIHISFTKAGDTDSKFFNIPLLGGTDEPRPKENASKLGTSLPDCSSCPNRCRRD